MSLLERVPASLMFPRFAWLFMLCKVFLHLFWKDSGVVGSGYWGYWKGGDIEREGILRQKVLWGQSHHFAQLQGMRSTLLTLGTTPSSLCRTLPVSSQTQWLWLRPLIPLVGMPKKMAYTYKLGMTGRGWMEGLLTLYFPGWNNQSPHSNPSSSSPGAVIKWHLAETFLSQCS